MSVFGISLSLAVTLATVNVLASAEVGRSQSERQNAIPALHSPQLQNNFIKMCLARGIREQFCKQITSPNTKSIGTFRQVYGDQPFVLMPNTDRWETGLQLLTIAESLAEFGEICEIRNWYRPEPYNRSVGGARSSQHLSAGAIDIEFCTVQDKNRALLAALATRQKFKTPPGIGVYGEGSKTLHFDFANRLYGPGIANADRAAATDAWWARVSEPGTNFRAQRQMSSRANRSQRPTSTTPQVQRQSINTFFRQIIAFFSPRSA